MFETLVVTELVKSNFNAGEKYELYFWRDNHRKEIDVILESGMKQSGIEIKCGKTIRNDAFSGLEYWKTLAKADTPTTYLVYAGDDSYERNGTRVVGWNALHEELVQTAIYQARP